MKSLNGIYSDLKNIILRLNFRPLVVVVLIYVSGILCGYYISVDVRWVFLILLISFLCLFLVFRFKNAGMIFLMTVLFLTAFLQVRTQWQEHKYSINHTARFYRGQSAHIKGIIISEPQYKQFNRTEKYSFILKVTHQLTPWGWKQKNGRILVNSFLKQNFAYGDSVYLSGKLHKPFEFSNGNFSYKSYLSFKDIKNILSVSKDSDYEIIESNKASKVYHLVIQLRKKLRAVLFEYLSSNEAGIMQAMLLGDRSQIPPGVRTVFERSGTAHILAISGLHIGIILTIFLYVLRLLPMTIKGRWVLLIMCLCFYALLTFGRPSIFRAVIMACILLFGCILEKRYCLIDSLSLAALVLLMINPFNLFDIGFQLSFICVLSIVFLFPLIDSLRLAYLQKFPVIVQNILIKPVIFSFSIWIGILGIVAYYFQIITPVVIIANLFIVPLTGAVLILGFGLLITAFIHPLAALACSLTLKFILNLLVLTAYLAARIPGAYFKIGSVSFEAIALYYAFVLIGLAFFMCQRKGCKL